MQDRYAGDIGDFGKYGLLRALCGDGLRLGVLWYAFEGDTGTNPGDGKRTEYLSPPDVSLRECDPDLFQQMHDVVYGGNRSIAAVEQSGALPALTVCHGEKLVFEPSERPPAREARRRDWLASALEIVGGADVVFADPDTGLQIPSMNPLVANGPKYAYYDDLVPCWERGQSLVIYQHADHAPGGMGLRIANRIEEIQSHFSGALQPIVLRWRRVSARAYFILPKPEHVDTIEDRVERFLDSEWGRREHFTRHVPIPPL